ncbi:hypothetical protein [Spiroplasma sp. BIUS-1]|uniref:hypothetical protein n=1 Tax=Spiroplasma sp. BIUS-1 TaxID=216964 RepID=UPI001399439F|nr:hypothetical protein [Spiroplasma sp. BIUS-1]QHX36372.1 hypothetical protein SBIUS_v1c01190 [Spiroplasma sp. BIUS-1]
MKKNLSLIAYISLAIALLNQVFVIAFVKPIYSKIHPENTLDELAYIIITICVVFLICIGLVGLIFIIKNTVKSAFVGSIILITLGVLLMCTLISFTWIFGSINIILGILLITVGSIHLKTTREYL